MHVYQDLELFAEQLKEFSLQSECKLGSLSSCEAVEYTCRYLYGHKNLPEWLPVQERVIYVAGQWARFSLRMYDFPELGKHLTYDFQRVIRQARFM